MKQRYYLILLLLFALTACAPGSGRGCKDGVCVKIKASEPIQLGIPIPITVTVTSEKDIEDLFVSFSTDFGVLVDTAGKSDVIWEDPDKRGIGWKKKVQGGQALEITQNVLIDHPSQVMIYVSAKKGKSLETLNISENSMTIYMTDTGGTMYLENTPIPRPSGIPVIATYPPGPIPTFMITSTRLPSPPPLPTSTPIPTATTFPYP